MEDQQQQQPVQIIEEKSVRSNGEIKVTKYYKRKFLGKGGFAKVYEFQQEGSSKILAGKVVEKASL